MTGLSAAGETLVLTALLNTVWVSLHTVDPGNGGDNEVSGFNYARQSAIFAQAGSNPTIASNNAIVQYPPATGPWGNVGYFGIWDAVTGGVFRGGWALEVPKSVTIDDTVRWDTGKLQIGTDEIIP